MRILALDWGSVRIGAAVSDENGKIAFPLERHIDSKKALDEIKTLVDDLKIEKILIGFPKNLSGNEGLSAKKVEDFVRNLKEKQICEIELIDERFSSVEAGKKLSAEGIKQKEQRPMVDNIAAQIMLQQYLDSK